MITSQKESNDITRLAALIRADDWMSSDTIIVTCSPDYSSILGQRLNHQLSHHNKNELYEHLPLEVPFPTMSQVWDRDAGEYRLFDRYLAEWTKKNISPSYQYLFVDTGCFLKGLAKVKAALNRLPGLESRYACLYLSDQSPFKPDYHVEVIPHNTLIFEWENPLNPNWDY